MIDLGMFHYALTEPFNEEVRKIVSDWLEENGYDRLKELQIYTITDGLYSDYAIRYILIGPTGLNIQAIHRKLLEDILEHVPAENYLTNDNYWNSSYQDTLDALQKMGFKEIDEALIEILKKEHGCIEIQYQEHNLKNENINLLAFERNVKRIKAKPKSEPISYPDVNSFKVGDKVSFGGLKYTISNIIGDQIYIVGVEGVDHAIVYPYQVVGDK